MKIDFLSREYGLYLQEHQHPLNRATHFVGIPLIVITPMVALLTWNIGWLIGGQVLGWFFQVLGHWFEGNRPALLKRPISLVMGPLMVMVEMMGFWGIRPRFVQQTRIQGNQHSLNSPRKQ